MKPFCLMNCPLKKGWSLNLCKHIREALSLEVKLQPVDDKTIFKYQDGERMIMKGSVQ